MCIKKMISTDSVFTSIEVGDWIEVYEKSIYDISIFSFSNVKNVSKDPNSSSCYFYYPPRDFLRNNLEYAFSKSNFITLEQWRESQLNKLL
jgi:hypothetical protein